MSILNLFYEPDFDDSPDDSPDNAGIADNLAHEDSMEPMVEDEVITVADSPREPTGAADSRRKSQDGGSHLLVPDSMQSDPSTPTIDSGVPCSDVDRVADSAIYAAHPVPEAAELLRRRREEEIYFEEKRRVLIEREIQQNRLVKDEEEKRRKRGRVGNYLDPVHAEEVYVNPSDSMVPPRLAEEEELAEKVSRMDEEVLVERSSQEDVAENARTKTYSEKLGMLQEWNAWKANNKDYAFFKRYIAKRGESTRNE